LGGTEVGQMVSQIDSLPALPDAYSRLLAELASPEASLTAVGKIVETDMAMTAKLLQLANSAFFGLRQRVSSAAQAVSFLGMETVKALVLMVGVFAQHADKKHSSKLPLDYLWNHSLMVGALAEAIAKCLPSSPQIATDSFASGLLHDCGMLILAQCGGTSYENVLDIVRRDRVRVDVQERLELGCTHGEVGGYLLGIWGLPDAVVEAVAFHHDPGRSSNSSFGALTAVHVANSFAHAFEEGSLESGTAFLDMTYLHRLGLTNKIAEWREHCLAIQKTAGEQG
jgi:HD-like signal output (HDOD) protein